jgi:hypothetical protein
MKIHSVVLNLLHTDRNGEANRRINVTPRCEIALTCSDDIINKYTGIAHLSFSQSRAIAQVVSRRLPFEAARVLYQVRPCAICGGQGGTGVGFLRVFGFLVPILIPPTARHSLIILSPTPYSLNTDSAVK